MLSYSLRTNSAPRLDSKVPFDRRVSVVPRTATSRFTDDYSGLDEEQVRHFRPGLLPDFPARDVIDHAVDIFPSGADTRDHRIQLSRVSSLACRIRRGHPWQRRDAD